MNILELSQTAGNYAQAANQASGIVSDIFGKNGAFGHSQHYQILKNGEAQNEVNKQMAQWNMENVTKPVFEMENKEWDRRFQEQNAEWERQWGMQNEYNTPAAQVQRMREAGLNPAGMNMDSGGTAAPGNVGSPTVNEAASAFANPASIFDAMRAEAELKTANARVEQMHQQNRLTERDIEEKTINNKTLEDLNAGRCALQWAEVETEGSKQTLNRAQANQAKAMLRQIDENCKNLIEERKLTQQKVANTKEEWSEIRSRTFLNQAQEGLTDAQTNKVNLDAEWQKVVNKYADLNQQWSINTMKAKFTLDQAQAKEAMELGKQIALGNDIKNWKFDNLKEKWRVSGQWELSLEGARVQAKWKDGRLLLDMDDAQRKWKKNYQTWMAAYWYADDITSRLKRGAHYMGTYKENPSMGTQGATPSYQDYYNP